jgi:hypothetical protein
MKDLLAFNCMWVIFWMYPCTLYRCRNSWNAACPRILTWSWCLHQGASPRWEVGSPCSPLVRLRSTCCSWSRGTIRTIIQDGAFSREENKTVFMACLMRPKNEIWNTFFQTFHCTLRDCASVIVSHYRHAKLHVTFMRSMDKASMQPPKPSSSIIY